MSNDDLPAIARKVIPDFLIWHCAGCGAPAEGKKKPCNCTTNVGTREGPNGGHEQTWWDDPLPEHGDNAQLAKELRIRAAGGHEDSRELEIMCGKAADALTNADTHISTLTTRLAQAVIENAKSKDEIAWLIEMVDERGVTGHYYCAGVRRWDNDHMLATRFCRQEDAAAIIHDMKLGRIAKPIEHMWCVPALPAPPGTP